jgi:uncharacterized protein (DUF1778 family)
MTNKNKPAVLTAALLNPEAPARSDAPAADAPPFFVKGSASAAQFRPDPDRPPAPPRPPPREPPAAVEAPSARPVRLAFEVKPELHRRIKQAAEARGQSLEAFLIGALDAAIKDRIAPAKPTPGRKGAKRRAKLVFAVDRRRQAALKRVLARSGGSQQGFLLAAAEAHAKRPVRTKPLLPVGAGADAEIIAFPRTGGVTRRRKPEKAASCRGIGSGAFSGGTHDGR